MLEDLAANLLQRLLGRYVQGLEGRNLRVAVWSGRVVLENLTLRPSALVGLLPVRVRTGFVGRVEMVVPWRKLGSMPVTLVLDRVHVLAGPLNGAQWEQADEEANRWREKQARRGLDHRDGAAEGPGDGGELEPDEAAPDHHRPRAGGDRGRQRRPQRLRVGERAQAQHAGRLDPRQRGPGVAGAGGEDQVVVGDRRAGGERDCRWR